MKAAGSPVGARPPDDASEFGLPEKVGSLKLPQCQCSSLVGVLAYSIMSAEENHEKVRPIPAFGRR